MQPSSGGRANTGKCTVPLILFALALDFTRLPANGQQHFEFDLGTCHYEENKLVEITESGIFIQRASTSCCLRHELQIRFLFNVPSTNRFHYKLLQLGILQDILEY